MAQITSIHGEVEAKKCHEKHKGIKMNPINGWRTRTIAAITQLTGIYKFLEIHKL